MDLKLEANHVMKCTVYKHGIRLGEISIDEISEALQDQDTFVWLGLLEPDKPLLLKIQDEFDLHDLAIEDACSAAHQRPKIEEYGDSLFLVLRTAALNEDNINFGETHIFVGRRFVVTVRHHSPLDHSKIRSRCEVMTDQLAKGPGFVLYSVMDFIVDNYVPVIDGLQNRFENLELAIFENRSGRETLTALYELKRDLLLLKAAITPIIDICNELMRFHETIIPQDVGVYFRDIADHIKRIDESIDSTREMLISAMQVHLTFETFRQNEIVKRLAGWGAILAIPTMVFSWYGMNFKYMPELDWPYSYPVVIATVIISSGILYLKLKKSGWL